MPVKCQLTSMFPYFPSISIPSLELLVWHNHFNWSHSNFIISFFLHYKFLFYNSIFNSSRQKEMFCSTFCLQVQSNTHIDFSITGKKKKKEKKWNMLWKQSSKQCLGTMSWWLIRLQSDIFKFICGCKEYNICGKAWRKYIKFTYAYIENYEMAGWHH